MFDQRDWGLIIYDEVHLLPAPVFQVTAGLQARRRLGLTATLVREDGREDDVFALIGPKKVDVPWKVLENQGWIATASCTEIRLPLPEELRMPYAVADRRKKFRVASENPAKLDVARQILNQHPGEPTLIIGMYVEQIKEIAGELDVPVITGTTSQKKRDKLFEDFKIGPAAGAGRFESRQFRRRPARRLGGHSDIRHLRFAAGRSPAAGADPASQGRTEPSPFLHAGQPRHGRTGIRPQTPVVSLRTRLRLRYR